MQRTTATHYIFAFLAGFCVAWIWINSARLYSVIVQASPSFSEHRQGQFKLINPLLECDAGEESISNPLGISKFKLKNFVDTQLKSKNVDHVSVYFRDLNGGPWIGIMEKEEFIGASLMKVPLMIAYMKESESNPELFEQKIKYWKINPEVTTFQFFDPSKAIKLGNEYTIKELIEYMITYSDNNAANLLENNIAPEKILNVFLALGLGLPDFSKPYPVNVRTYGSFFRILFNSSYLSQEMSEVALEFLTKSEFSLGITATIPRDIIVAHKHGIRGIDELGHKQLHDCGIVYYPEHPYLLCIMTQGTNFNMLSKVIQDISKLVYEEIVAWKGS